MLVELGTTFAATSENVNAEIKSNMISSRIRWKETTPGSWIRGAVSGGCRLGTRIPFRPRWPPRPSGRGRCYFTPLELLGDSEFDDAAARVAGGVVVAGAALGRRGILVGDVEDRGRPRAEIQERAI